MNLRLLVNHSVCMFPLDLMVLGFRQGDVFLSFANRLGPRKLLEPRRGKDEREADDAAPNVGNRNPCIGRDEHGRATMHFSYGVSQMHSSVSVLQKEDFVGTRVSVRRDG